MTKVKTFTTPLEIFKTQGEIDKLDERINEFVVSKAARIVSVSDSITTDDGSTIGLIRTVVYEG